MIKRTQTEADHEFYVKDYLAGFGGFFLKNDIHGSKELNKTNLQRKWSNLFCTH